MFEELIKEKTDRFDLLFQDGKRKMLQKRSPSPISAK